MSETKTLRVTLADAPTDVLVYLVDHGQCDFRTLVNAVAPIEAIEGGYASEKVADALSLLIDMRWVTYVPSQSYRATSAGSAAVANARAEQEAAQ